MSASTNIHGVDPSSITFALKRYDRFATLDIRVTDSEGATFEFDLFLGDSFSHDSVDDILDEALKNLREQFRNIDNIVDNRDKVNA